MNRSIYIGYDYREADAFEVCRASLLRNLSAPISIHKLVLQDLQDRKLYTRPTTRYGNQLIDELSKRPDYGGEISTEHANARFCVPQLAHEGWALFMDCDMLVRGDLNEVFDMLNPARALYCVQHYYEPKSKMKMDGQVQTRYLRKNWSSFMVFNCDHAANWKLPDVVNVWPGRDLHALFWLKEDQIGVLPPEWNYLVGHTRLAGREPKVVHFTEGLPNMPGYEECEYADEWRRELAAVTEGRSISTGGRTIIASREDAERAEGEPVPSRPDLSME